MFVKSPNCLSASFFLSHESTLGFQTGTCYAHQLGQPGLVKLKPPLMDATIYFIIWNPPSYEILFTCGVAGEKHNAAGTASTKVQKNKPNWGPKADDKACWQPDILKSRDQLHQTIRMLEDWSNNSMNFFEKALYQVQ